MKLIENVTHATKPVMYFGVQFHIPNHHHYIATDCDGSVYSYIDKPHADEYYYMGEDAKYLGLAYVSENDNWRDSLMHVDW